MGCSKGSSRFARAETGKHCFLCGFDVGVFRHHIKPQADGGKSEKRNIVYLCENCHNKVEEQPNLIMEREQKITRLNNDDGDYPQEWIIHRDGKIIWVGTYYAWGMEYKLKEIDWETLLSIADKGKIQYQV